GFCPEPARPGAAGGGGRAAHRGRLAADARVQQRPADAEVGFRDGNLRSRAAIRAAVRQRAARLARLSPDRPAGRPDHIGADAVTAAAGVLKPAAAPAGTTRRILAGIRLTWLHLRTRRVPAGILALAVCGALLHAALHWHWGFNSGPYAQQVPMITEAGAAAVVAVTAHSPFGETERSAGRWLPCLRLLAAIGLTGLAIALLQLGAAGADLNDGIAVLARNVSGFTAPGLR